MFRYITTIIRNSLAVFVVCAVFFSLHVSNARALQSCDCDCYHSSTPTDITPIGSASTSDECSTACNDLGFDGSTLYSCVSLDDVDTSTSSATTTTTTSSSSAPAVTGPTCACFCSSSAGAVEVGRLAGAPECLATCQAQNKTMAVCAATYGQYPSANLRCFTRTACSNQEGVFSLDNNPIYQPPECLTGQGYCYPPPLDYTLAVSLGTVTSVAGLSGYISSAYKYLLNISVTIAIVFIMIGGLQYVLAAGSGNVSKAKEMISNALAGLVLLLFAYTILFTVNPNLVALQLPQLPMIKKVVLVGDESCEALKAKNFTIGSGEEIQDKYTGNQADPKCGSTTIVKTDENGDPLADGTTCDFDDCSFAGAGKMCVAGFEASKCVKCTDLHIGSSEAQGLVPNDSVCASLTLPNEDTKDTPPMPSKRNYCFWSSGSFRLTEADPTSVCVELAIDCTKVTKCSNYDTLEPDIPLVPNYNLELWASAEKINLEVICKADPCKAAIKEGGSSCTYNGGVLSGDCVLRE